MKSDREFDVVTNRRNVVEAAAAILAADGTI
jgi:hypothetical protein